MKLTHVVVASAALVSFSVIAADEAKKDQQAQSGQSQSQNAESPSKGGGQQMSQGKDLVKQAQEKLSAAGHDVGEADGILGPRTQKGLKEFQQSKGLQPSGQLDQKTIAALGVSGEASASTGASSDKGGSASAGASSEKSKEPSSTEKSK
jgi:peptidoglycan hydrolase-like protein with peptidoglycan-binding domain